jgi:signal transduction histidine kinase
VTDRSKRASVRIAAVPGQRRPVVPEQEALPGSAGGAPAGGFVAFSDPAALLDRLDNRSGADRREDDRRASARTGAAASEAGRLGVRELCHDLRQPVSAVLVLTELIAQEPGMTPVSRRRLSALQGEAQLLRDFLDHFVASRPRLRPLDLGGLAAEVVDLAAATAACDLEVRLRAQAVVTADRVLLHRALLNLVDNACRAAGRGKVRLTVDLQDGAAVVCIEDSGVAPDQVMAKGAGLGLHVATTVVEALGGTLAISDGELGGLRVVLLLPASVASRGRGDAP